MLNLHIYTPSWFHVPSLSHIVVAELQAFYCHHKGLSLIPYEYLNSIVRVYWSHFAWASRLIPKPVKCSNVLLMIWFEVEKCDNVPFSVSLRAKQTLSMIMPQFTGTLFLHHFCFMVVPESWILTNFLSSEADSWISNSWNLETAGCCNRTMILNTKKNKFGKTCLKLPEWSLQKALCLILYKVCKLYLKFKSVP